MIMGAMLAGVFMVMHIGISSMGMLMDVFVQMLVGVRYVPMWVLMGVDVFVLMFSFHYCHLLS